MPAEGSAVWSLSELLVPGKLMPLALLIPLVDVWLLDALVLLRVGLAKSVELEGASEHLPQ